MAMMASASSGNPYDNLNNTQIEQDLIDPDDANINDLDEPNEPSSDRAPLTGNIQNSSRNPLPQSYLNSTLPGEDRRAPTNTIDESVWDTLSRDLLAVWEKMRQVLWPKYLLGGLLQRGGGLGGAERGEGDSLAGGFRGIVGRWPDADVVLQGGMSEGLRDWDLWGPLIFCLLLSLLLSMTASSEQKTIVFSGVFALIWIGEAVVTAQIKLLGGNMYGALLSRLGNADQAFSYSSFFQSVCIIGYTLFPLVVAALLSAVHLPMVARIPVYIVLVAWSLAAGISILGGSGVDRRDLKMTPETTPHEHEQQRTTTSDVIPSDHHDHDLKQLRPSTDNYASDNDASERPVREKLKKTSIASMPRNDAIAKSIDATVESILSTRDEDSQQRSSSDDETPSPKSESRGRLSRKRSYDDTVDSAGVAGEASSEIHDDDDGDAKHARKRSRDVRAGHTLVTESPSTPPAQMSPPRESQSGKSGSNDEIDQEIDDSAQSPRKKRSREEFDVEAQRGQKIAATDEAKAYRRSEDSEGVQPSLSEGKGAFTVDSTVREEQSPTTEKPSILQNPRSPPTELEPSSPEAPEPSSQKAPEDPIAEQKAAEKVPTSFAASGFAAMSNSSKSPFGTFGTSTSSVFRPTPASTSDSPAKASKSADDPQNAQTATSTTSGNTPSPFLTSAASTEPSGFGFGANGAAPKPSGFGGSVFGSAFMNKGATAPKLTSFAAPTGDLAPPKPAESTKAFGTQAEDSAEEEGGSDDEANPDEVGVKDDEIDSRFHQQQEVETGEAGEVPIFTSSRAQLYYYDSGGWHEKGKGAFKLNVAESDNEKKARFIMRAHQTYRVLLNQPVFKRMQVGGSKGQEPSGKNFSFAVIDQGRPTPHLLKLSDENESRALYREVLRLQEDMETQT
ncbi:MAG: hypothetical protein Q9184_003172 [Pyrenodesmia sp. 2 TL-2023]